MMQCDMSKTLAATCPAVYSGVLRPEEVNSAECAEQGGHEIRQ